VVEPCRRAAAAAAAAQAGAGFLAEDEDPDDDAAGAGQPLRPDSVLGFELVLGSDTASAGDGAVQLPRDGKSPVRSERPALLGLGGVQVNRTPPLSPAARGG
jgi:hypothetical protein